MNPYDQTNPHQMDRHDGYDWSFPAQQYPGGYVQPSAHEHNSLFAVPSQAALKPAFNFASGQVGRTPPSSPDKHEPRGLRPFAHAPFCQPLQQGAPQLSSPSGMQHLQGEEATLTAAMDQAQTRWEGLSKELEGIQKELDCEITDAERRRLNKRYNTLDRQIAIAQQEYGLNKRELDKLRRDPSSRAIQATNPYLQLPPTQNFPPLLPPHFETHPFSLYAAPSSASSNMGPSSGCLSPLYRRHAHAGPSDPSHIAAPQFRPQPRHVATGSSSRDARLDADRARLRKVIDDEVKARSEAASREEKGVNSNSYRKHSKRVTRAKNDYWRFMEAHNWVDDDDTLLRKMKETDSKERTKGPARKP